MTVAQQPDPGAGLVDERGCGLPMGDVDVVRLDVGVDREFPVDRYVTATGADEVEPAGEIAELGEVLGHREHPLAERRSVRIEVDEHERPPRLATDVRQGETRRVEVAEVAGIRIPRQGAVEAVHPTVVRAREPTPGLPRRLQDERRTPVLARVEERPHPAVVLTDQDDRAGHAVEAYEVARLGQLVQMRDVQPRPAEDVLTLELVDALIAVALRRYQRQHREPVRIVAPGGLPPRLGQDRLDHRRAHSASPRGPLGAAV